MPRPSEPVAVRHPEAGCIIVLDPGTDYADDDPLVTSYAWAFAPRNPKARLVESAPIEAATARPGEKRSTRR